MSKRVAVLVVDDSPICRELISEALMRDPDLYIAGRAENGQQAVELAKKLRPDVITMDVEMPVMDGLEAVEHIMASSPTPILMLTADPRHQAPELSCRSLELGALALQVKPALDAGPEAWNLAREVKLLSSVKVIRHLRGLPRAHGKAAQDGTAAARPAGVAGITPGSAFASLKAAGQALGASAAATAAAVPVGTPPLATGMPLSAAGVSVSSSTVGVVAIASSTGGPQVIHRMVSQLPADFPAPIVLVQHINEAFAESLAGWLQSAAKIKVKLATDGDPLLPGQLLVAPPGLHMVIPSRGRVSLQPGDPKDGHRPSGTLLLQSAASAYGRRAAGVVLTGMGADGAAGLAAIHAAGGRTLAQSQESSVVFGMPGAAIAKGVVDHIVHGDELAQVLVQLTRGFPSASMR